MSAELHDKDCPTCDGERTVVCGRCPDRWAFTLGAVCDNQHCDGGMEPCPDCQSFERKMADAESAGSLVETTADWAGDNDER